MRTPRERRGRFDSYNDSSFGGGGGGGPGGPGGPGGGGGGPGGGGMRRPRERRGNHNASVMRAIRFRNSGIEAFNQMGVKDLVVEEGEDEGHRPTFSRPAKPVHRRAYPAPAMKAHLRTRGDQRRSMFKINA